MRVSLALERSVQWCFALVWGLSFPDFLWFFDKFYIIFINCSLIADYTQLDRSLQFALYGLSCLYKLCLLILADIEIKVQDFDMWVKKYQNLERCIHCSFIQIQICSWLEYLFKNVVSSKPPAHGTQGDCSVCTVLQLLYRPKLPCNLIVTEVINHL